MCIALCNHDRTYTNRNCYISGKYADMHTFILGERRLPVQALLRERRRAAAGKMPELAAAAAAAQDMGKSSWH